MTRAHAAATVPATTARATSRRVGALRAWWKRRSRRLRDVIVAVHRRCPPCCSSRPPASSTRRPRCRCRSASTPRRSAPSPTATARPRSSRSARSTAPTCRCRRVSLDARTRSSPPRTRTSTPSPASPCRGILRALWTDIRGGEVSQGGSTITQQYAKNAYLTQERTVHPQDQGDRHRDQARQEVLQGPDPRVLPEHDLLRPRRVRHPGGGRELLRDPGVQADGRAGRRPRRPDPGALRARPPGQPGGRRSPVPRGARHDGRQELAGRRTRRDALKLPPTIPLPHQRAERPARPRRTPTSARRSSGS